MGVYLLLINAVALLLMLADKLFAKKHARRIPESTLMLSSVVGGSIGSLVGMYLFRHKTKHKKFTVGIPLILILQLTAVIVYRFIL